jgi:hypothetical protein
VELAEGAVQRQAFLLASMIFRGRFIYRICLFVSRLVNHFIRLLNYFVNHLVTIRLRSNVSVCICATLVLT